MAKGIVTKNKIDGTKANVRGANTIDFNGICPMLNLIVGKIYFPNIVKPKPKTICKEPMSQKIGPKNEYGFLLKKVLNKVQPNKNNQIAVNKNIPINKPTQIPLTVL